MDSRCAALRHQNLVRMIVKTYFLNMMHFGYDFDDLVQEGLYAVMRAEARYDPAKGQETTFYARAVRNWLSWRMGTRKINGIDRAYRNPVRLDKPAVNVSGDTIGCTLLDLLPDPDAEFEQSTVDLIGLRAALARLCDNNPRLAEIIRLRYWDELMLKEIGAEIGLSRQRAEQLLKRGLAALREYMEEKEEKTA